MDDGRFRLVVLGASKVGKTNIIRRYLYDDFCPKHKETIEDLHSRDFLVKGVPLPLDILDTNINFPDMRKISINTASAFLLVFSVENVTSFKEMSDLWQEISASRPDIKEIPVVVAGNKCDVNDKKIREETARTFTNRLCSDVRYMEVSAKSNIGIKEIFSTFLELSGFPKCKAGGGGLDDPQIGMMKKKFHSLHLTDGRPTFDKNKDKKQLEVSDKTDRINDSLCSPSRNIKQGLFPKLSVDNTSSCHSNSVLRRTKHLSLRIRRPEKSTNPEMNDDSKCQVQ